MYAHVVTYVKYLGESATASVDDHNPTSLLMIRVRHHLMLSHPTANAVDQAAFCTVIAMRGAIFDNTCSRLACVLLSMLHTRA